MSTQKNIQLFSQIIVLAHNLILKLQLSDFVFFLVFLLNLIWMEPYMPDNIMSARLCQVGTRIDTNKITDNKLGGTV